MVKKAAWVLFCLAVLLAAYKALPDDLNNAMDGLKEQGAKLSQTVKDESDKRLNTDNLPAPPKILPQQDAPPPAGEVPSTVEVGAK